MKVLLTKLTSLHAFIRGGVANSHLLSNTTGGASIVKRVMKMNDEEYDDDV